MKIVKIVLGALLGIGCLLNALKLLTALPGMMGGAYNMSYMLGALAGTLLMGALSYALIKSGLDEDSAGVRR